MRILDRYMTAPIFVIFLTTVMVFSMLFVLIDTASNLDEFIDRQVGLQVLIQYYLNYLPVFIVKSSPIACLIAVLFTYTGLNNHNELVVLRSSGMNFWQIAKPALCFGIIIASCVFLINERIIPEAENALKKIKSDNLMLETDRKHKKMAEIKNLTFYGLKNRLYFIDNFDPNTADLNGITIIGYDNQQVVKEKIVALKGKWTGIAWKFYQCHITTFDQDVNSPTTVKVYEDKLLDIKETPEDFLKQRLNVEAMNIQELKSYISRFADSGATRAINNLRVDMHEKIAFPFANIVIILVGLPIVMVTGRRRAATFTSLGIAVAIGFLYFVCYSVGLALGKGDILPPMLSAWIAPLLFSTIALYLIRRSF